jgi:hypothetical protein
MTWGISTDTLLQIHVALSLIGIVSGLIMLYGLLNGNHLAGWTALFLLTTIRTGVTGFLLPPPFDFDPARTVQWRCRGGTADFTMGGRTRRSAGRTRSRREAPRHHQIRLESRERIHFAFIERRRHGPSMPRTIFMEYP